MVEDNWSQVQALYLRAEALPQSERATFLDQACAGDALLRVAVEALLLSRETIVGTAATAGGAGAGSRAADEPLAEGTRLGPWSIGRLVGRGGMGEVYEARRADGAFELRVAIKLLKRGLDTDAMVERFGRERRILAQLGHPNIAYVLDAGATADGRPYLAMEFVDGQPITGYARGGGLSTQAILRLMITVCEAVQAAHAKRIIHRDLKPSNVLVSAQGQVKLLDFGVAKALAEEDAEATRLLGGEALLTPAYAAPEQLLGRAPSPATDVHSLGVILYQLLAERLPYQRAGRGTGEIITGLGEETVQRLSTALRRERGRLPEPLRLERLGAVSRDLDLILLKALHADPARRYATAQDFADDLRCFLERRPVLARPDSLGYRLGRFVARNRRLLAQVGAAAAVVALLGAGALLLQERRHGQERRQAQIGRWIDLGQKEAASRHYSRAAAYFGAAYSADPGSADLRFLLARVMPSVEALTPRAFRFDSPRIFTVAYAPDGRTVVAVGVSGENSEEAALMAWERDSGKLLARIEHVCVGRAMAFSRDGRRVLVVGSKNQVQQTTALSQVFDLQAGKLLLQVEGSAAPADYGPGLAPAFLPADADLELLAVLDGKGGAQVWEVGSGKLRTQLQMPGGINSAAFSPDQELLATASNRGEVTVWDARSGKPGAHLQSQPAAPVAAVFGAGNRLVTISGAGVLNLWDARDGAWQGALGSQDGELEGLYLSPDGRLLGTVPAHGPFKVWDLAAGNAGFSSSELSTEATLPLHFDAAGSGFLSSAEAGAFLWDLGNSGNIGAGLDIDLSTIFGFSLSRDGRHAITGGSDHLVREWDLAAVRDQPQLRRLALRLDPAAPPPDYYFAMFDEAGQHLLTVGPQGSVRSWPLAGGAPTALGPPGPPALTASISANRRYLVTSHADRVLRVWDLRQGKALAALGDGHPAPTLHVAVSGDGTAAASADSQAPYALLWDVAAGKPRARLESDAGLLFGPQFSPDGKRLLTESAQGTVMVWDAASGKALLKLLGHAKRVRAAWSADGGRILSAANDHTARLWDANTGALLQTLDRNAAASQYWSVALSPDGRYAALGNSNGEVELWDLRDGGVRVLSGLSRGVAAVQFSADGSLVTAAVGRAEKVGVWSTASGRLLFSNGSDDSNFWLARFSPDQNLLAAAGPERDHVYLWDLKPERRDAAAIAAVLDCDSPWAVQDDALVARPVHPESCGAGH